MNSLRDKLVLPVRSRCQSMMRFGECQVEKLFPEEVLWTPQDQPTGCSRTKTCQDVLLILDLSGKMRRDKFLRKIALIMESTATSTRLKNQLEHALWSLLIKTELCALTSQPLANIRLNILRKTSILSRRLYFWRELGRHHVQYSYGRRWATRQLHHAYKSVPHQQPEHPQGAKLSRCASRT